MNDEPIIASPRQDQRRYPRHLVYWPVTLFPDKPVGKAAILHGETCELSMNGASILSESNFTLQSPVMLQLTIPPQVFGQAVKTIEIRCCMVHAYLDARHHRFRIGFDFMELNEESKILLNETLASHLPSPY